MCVDDYAFRHFSAIRDKVCRKFMFIDQEDNVKTYYVNISQFEEFGDVALCKILIYLSSKGLNIENKKFYLPKFTAIIEPFTFCRIIFESLDEKEIILKTYPMEKNSEEIFAENQGQDTEFQSYHQSQENKFCYFDGIGVKEDMELFDPNMKTNSTEQIKKSSPQPMDIQRDIQSSSEEKTPAKDPFQRSNSISQDHHKKPKEAERVIGQVITAVKIWRGLHQSKRCNLTNAAKVVGISKKSLDDYYLVLRVGEKLGYDYANNLENMMGDLRNFIRLQEQKVTGKLGKELRCLDLVEQIDLQKVMQQYRSCEMLQQ